MFDVEGDLPYLGLDKENMDIFVHFVEKTSVAPRVIRNQDPDKFNIFYTREDSIKQKY